MSDFEHVTANITHKHKYFAEHAPKVVIFLRKKLCEGIIKEYDTTRVQQLVQIWYSMSLTRGKDSATSDNDQSCSELAKSRDIQSICWDCLRQFACPIMVRKNPPILFKIKNSGAFTPGIGLLQAVLSVPPFQEFFATFGLARTSKHQLWAMKYMSHLSTDVSNRISFELTTKAHIAYDMATCVFPMMFFYEYFLKKNLGKPDERDHLNSMVLFESQEHSICSVCRRDQLIMTNTDVFDVVPPCVDILSHLSRIESKSNAAAPFVCNCLPYFDDNRRHVPAVPDFKRIYTRLPEVYIIQIHERKTNSTPSRLSSPPTHNTLPFHIKIDVVDKDKGTYTMGLYTKDSVEYYQLVAMVVTCRRKSDETPDSTAFVLRRDVWWTTTEQVEMTKANEMATMYNDDFRRCYDLFYYKRRRT